RENATIANRRADLLKAQQLAGRSEEAANDTVSALLALKAHFLNRLNGGDSTEPKIYSAMVAALERFNPQVRLRTPNFIPYQMKFDPADGKAFFVSVEGTPYRSIQASRGSDYESPQVKSLRFSNRALAISDDRKTVWLADEDHQIYQYDADDLFLSKDAYKKSEDPILMTGHTGRINKMVYDSDNKRLYSAGQDGKVFEWDVTADPPKRRELFSNITVPITALAISDNGKLIAVGTDDLITVTSHDWEDFHLKYPTKSRVTSIDFHPRYRKLAFGMENGWVGFVDVEDANYSSLSVHASRVSDIAYSPNGRFIASASYDRTVRMFEINHEDDEPIVFSGHRSWVLGLQFSQDSRQLYSFSKDQQVRTWYTEPDAVKQRICDIVQRRDLGSAAKAQYEFKEDVQNYLCD
ncbi:MAG: hypothetical protein AAF570_23575, partial [Bacteroidota bacterium]